MRVEDAIFDIIFLARAQAMLDPAFDQRQVLGVGRPLPVHAGAIAAQHAQLAEIVAGIDHDAVRPGGPERLRAKLDRHAMIVLAAPEGEPGTCVGHRPPDAGACMMQHADIGIAPHPGMGMNGHENRHGTIAPDRRRCDGEHPASGPSCLDGGAGQPRVEPDVSDLHGLAARQPRRRHAQVGRGKRGGVACAHTIGLASAGHRHAPPIVFEPEQLGVRHAELCRDHVAARPHKRARLVDAAKPVFEFEQEAGESCRSGRIFPGKAQRVVAGGLGLGGPRRVPPQAEERWAHAATSPLRGGLRHALRSSEHEPACETEFVIWPSLRAPPLTARSATN